MSNEKRERRTFGYLRQLNGVWWVRYRVGGQEKWENLHTASEKVARDKAAVIGNAVGKGEHTPGDARRVSFKDLESFVLTAAKKDKLRSVPRIERALTHLRDAFGASRALAITTERIAAYEVERLESGDARATINYELSILRRMFRLAVKARRLPSMPAITIRDPHNVRTNIITADDFAALLEELPDYLKPAIAFSYHTGWRTASEVLPIEWRNVDMKAGTLRIDDSKNKEGRSLPYAALPQLKAIIDKQRESADAWQKATGEVVTFVFHRHGKRIRSYKNAWEAARDRAAHGGKKPGDPRELVRPNLVGAIVHDLRRTAITNMESAGVARSVATKISGHKTESVYRRYAISKDDQLRAGLAKLGAHLDPSQSAAQSPQDAPGATKGNVGGI